MTTARLDYASYCENNNNLKVLVNRTRQLLVPGTYEYFHTVMPYQYDTFKLSFVVRSVQHE